MNSSSRQQFIKSAITRHHDVRTTLARRLHIELMIYFTHIYGERDQGLVDTLGTLRFLPKLPGVIIRK